MNPIFNARIAVFCTTMVVLSGCAAPLPTVKTVIPDTAFVVALHGPDEKHHWRYSIYENGVLAASRFLGPADVDVPIKPQVTKDRDGRVTVAWASSPGRAFTTIDIKARTVSVDSNAANPSDQPFSLQR